MPPVIAQVRQDMIDVLFKGRTTATRLNSCLVNRYENGRDYVPFHADDEKMFRPKGDIVSVSFGPHGDL